MYIVAGDTFAAYAILAVDASAKPISLTSAIVASKIASFFFSSRNLIDQ